MKDKNIENKEAQEEVKDQTAEEKAEETSETTEQTETSQSVDSDIVALQQQLGETKEKYLRLYSDFENFRRRTAKEKLELTKTAGEKIIVELLSVIDDFDRAKKAYEDAEEPSFDSLKDGFELIMNKFLKVLEQQNVSEMKAIGEEFNPDIHEAIAQIPAPSEDMKGKVIDVIEKGYQIDDKVIRYAKVVTGN